jgi:hypothetical protein
MIELPVERRGIEALGICNITCGQFKIVNAVVHAHGLILSHQITGENFGLERIVEFSPTLLNSRSCWRKGSIRNGCPLLLAGAGGHPPILAGRE